MCPYEFDDHVRVPVLFATVSAGAAVAFTGNESVDCAPSPTALRAATRNEYDCPFDSPVTTSEVGGRRERVRRLRGGARGTA